MVCAEKPGEELSVRTVAAPDILNHHQVSPFCQLVTDLAASIFIVGCPAEQDGKGAIFIGTIDIGS
jgi:hypothetical protein